MSRADKKVSSVSRDWEPSRRIDGTIEISVRYFHENGRIASNCVAPEVYADLFLSNRLMWQVEGKERPEHNPTLEELADILERHQQADSAAQTTAWSAHLDRALGEPGVPRAQKQLPELSPEEEARRAVAVRNAGRGRHAGLSRAEKMAAFRSASKNLKARGFHFSVGSLVTEVLNDEAMAGRISFDSLKTFAYTQFTAEEEKELGFVKRKKRAGRR
jgi:hypothetical protein